MTKIFHLIVLISTTVALKLATTNDHAGLPDDATDAWEDLTIGTADDIVFDHITKPTCQELFEYAALNEQHLTFANLKTASISQCADPVFQKRVNVASTRNSTTDKPIQYLHISKAGGTFLCQCAARYGEHTKVKGNCNGLPEDRQFWGTKGSQPRYAKKKPVKTDNCQALLNQYDAQGFTFEGNENFLANEGKLCRQFEYLTTIRSPLHRIASHVQMITRNAKKFSAQYIFNAFPYIFNNFHARNLGGRHVSELSASDMLAQADSIKESLTQTLHKFDVLLIVGADMNENLKLKYGWDCSSVFARKSDLKGGTQEIIDHWQKTWSKDDFSLFEEHNAIDIHLFQEAQKISMAQSLLRRIDRGL